MTDQLDAIYLRQILTYAPETGVFVWAESRGAIKRGAIAGNRRPDGYSYIKIDGVLYRSTRLAFRYMTGAWPKEHVDHINGTTSDDRWANLREVTRSQNQANRRCVNKNGSVKGVFKRRGRYRVSISKDNRRYALGSEDNEADAVALYKAAAYLLFGEYAREVSGPNEFLPKARAAIERAKRPQRVPVVCLDTDRRFSSMVEAAKFAGTSIQAVRAAIMRNGLCGGRRFGLAA